MKIYVLVYEENSGCRCGADVLLFRDSEVALTKMHDWVDKMVHIFCEAKHDFRYGGNDQYACIEDGFDIYKWRIEIQEI